MLYLSEEDRRELAFWERIPISNRGIKDIAQLRDKPENTQRLFQYH
jgi:hypothetical protein